MQFFVNSFCFQIEFYSMIDFGSYRNMISDTKHRFLNNADIIEAMIIKHAYTFFIKPQCLSFHFIGNCIRQLFSIIVFHFYTKYIFNKYLEK